MNSSVLIRVHKADSFLREIMSNKIRLDEDDFFFGYCNAQVACPIVLITRVLFPTMNDCPQKSN